MRSSSGAHYVALDHIRGLACALVFAWHFQDQARSTRAALTGPTAWLTPMLFPLALFEQGHTGVALFMTLSGYLFTKLLDGKHIRYLRFLWNRLVRLAPLLLVVNLGLALRWHLLGGAMDAWLHARRYWLLGIGLRHGMWSVVTEFHFYALLPALLWAARRWRGSLPCALALSVLVRVLLYFHQGAPPGLHIRGLAYFSIVGRLDQFLCGMLCYQERGAIAGRHGLAAAVFVTFSSFYAWYAQRGGFHRFPHTWTSWIWVLMPGVEGAAYGVLLTWYDTSVTPPAGVLMDTLAVVGNYSYSIYLLHFYYVYQMRALAEANFPWIRVNFYGGLLAACVALLCSVPLGFLSYTCFEEPFLGMRVKYTTDRPAALLGADRASKGDEGQVHEAHVGHCDAKGLEVLNLLPQEGVYMCSP